MSKMLKLLNKAREIRGDNAAFGDSCNLNISSTAALKNQSFDKYDMHTHSTDQPSSKLDGLSRALIVFVVVVAVVSLFVSYRAMTEIYLNRQTSQELTRHNELYKQQLAKMDQSISDLKSNQAHETTLLKIQLKDLELRIKDSKVRLDNVISDSNINKSLFKELKETNLITVNRLLGLERQIQTLEAKISQPEGNR